MTIWKFSLQIGDTVLNLRDGYRILSLQMQNDVPTIWVLLDPDRPMTATKIICRGTGHHFNEREMGEYIGSVVTQGDAFVWHSFNLGEL